MRRLRPALWPAALALGIAAEALGRPELPVLDAAAGFALVGFGLGAWTRRPASRVGPLLLAAGSAWFAGTLAAPAVYLHRGPLAHVVSTYPGRSLLPPSRLERAWICAAYVYAVVYPLADDDRVTIAFALTLVAVALRRFAVAGGAERRARAAALAAAVGFGGVLALAAASGLASAGNPRAILGLYDVTVALVALLLFADLVFGRWTRAAVTGVVVRLGDPAAGTLSERLARTVGDPSLVVAYRLPGGESYVDELGRRVDPRAAGPGRAVTWIDDGGAPVAAVVHDATALEDPELLAGVAAATRLAVSNARLQADVRTRAAEVEASRRRIVEAADAQRRRLEEELREGPERRLAHVAELVAESAPELAAELADAREGLRELARGIHPTILGERGLAAALAELAARSPVAVDVTAPPERFSPAVETAAYFLCSEALANAAKHARATRVHIAVVVSGERVVVSVEDDGVGGANPTGSGLRGLADRVEAAGGRLTIESEPAAGTRLVAELPLSAPS